MKQPLPFLCVWLVAVVGCQSESAGLAVESVDALPDAAVASADAAPAVDARPDEGTTPPDLAPEAGAPDTAPLAPDAGPSLCAEPAAAAPCSGPLPRSCDHLFQTAGVRTSGPYWLDPDGDGAIPPFVTYCDMQPDSGGWTLIAKVNTADVHNVVEPRNWFALEATPGALASVTFEKNRSPSSHGAYKFASLLGPHTLARFELHAQEDPLQTARWYKAVASPNSFLSWFGSDSTPSRVCTDPEMTLNCSDGTITENKPGLGATVLGGMTLKHYGFQVDAELHMRLDTDEQPWASAVCSSTWDYQSNAWKDTYFVHWGNGLLIWLK
jgi:hypothetical protein